MKAFHLGVLPLGSLDGRDGVDFVFDDALHEFHPDDANLPPVPNPLPPPAPVIPPPSDVGTSTLWPN